MGRLDIWKKLRGRDTFTQRAFECKRGGLTIRGTEYRPAGEALPAAIVCHGFMAFQGTVRKYTKELARLGYAAYCFDFCGGSVAKGKSDGKTTDMSVLTEVEDLEAVIAYVQSLPYIGGELLMMGCSQGGFVSALTAARHPGLASELVLFYPALCIPDDARAGKMMAAKFDPRNIPERLDCGPMKLGRCYPAAVIGMDAFQEIRGYDGPVLLVHGTGDKIVHPDYARRAKDCYANAELHLIEGGAHGFSGKHDAAAMEALRQFVRKNGENRRLNLCKEDN